MKFKFLPKGTYAVGQRIKVEGTPMTVESYSHTGKNIVAVSEPGATRFDRILIILTDAQPIEALDI